MTLTIFLRLERNVRAGTANLRSNDHLDEFSAIMIQHGETDLSVKELADLGFLKIADSELLFRPNMLENPYSAIKDERDSLDLHVSGDVEAFIELEWEELNERD